MAPHPWQHRHGDRQPHPSRPPHRPLDRRRLFPLKQPLRIPLLHCLGHHRHPLRRRTHVQQPLGRSHDRPRRHGHYGLRCPHPARHHAGLRAPSPRPQIQLADDARQRHAPELLGANGWIFDCDRLPPHHPRPTHRTQRQLSRHRRIPRQKIFSEASRLRPSHKRHLRPNRPNRWRHRSPPKARHSNRHPLPPKTHPSRHPRQHQLPHHRPRLPPPHHRHHRRSSLGQRSLGLLLELGPQRNLGPHHLASLRRLPPRPHHKGLARQKTRPPSRLRLRRRLDLLPRRKPSR